MPEPIHGNAYEFTLTLVATATGQLLTSPPLSAGDFTVAKNHGALTALATLPTVAPAGSALVRVQLSATEMTANQVDVVAHDPDGVWEDVVIQIQPTSALGSDGKVLLSSGAITAAQLSVDACEKVTDVLARRPTSAIEGSSYGATLTVNSLYGSLAMTTGHKRDTTSHVDKLTVFQSNGTTELAQVVLTTDAAAEPIVQVGG